MLEISAIVKKTEALFDLFNEHFYNGELTRPAITISPDGGRDAYGWCSVNEMWKAGDDTHREINLCAEYLDRPMPEVCGTMLHEMAHLYNIQQDIADVSNNGYYHNKRFKDTAEAHGLIIHEFRSYRSITQQQAIDIMYAYYEENYGLKREDFDESRMAVSFSENTWDDGTGPQRLTTWGMDLWLKSDPVYPMAISILPDGTIKQATGPYVRTSGDDWYDTLMAEDFWTVEGLYRFKLEWGAKAKQILASKEPEDRYLPRDVEYLLTKDFGLPKASDITRDTAYSIAYNAILASGFDKTHLSYFAGVREAYLNEDSGRSIYKFVFHFGSQWQAAEELCQSGLIPRKIVVCIQASDGELVSLGEDNLDDGPGRFGI